jgi:hypothetical protein
MRVATYVDSAREGYDSTEWMISVPNSRNVAPLNQKYSTDG